MTQTTIFLSLCSGYNSKVLRKSPCVIPVEGLDIHTIEQGIVTRDYTRTVSLGNIATRCFNLLTMTGPEFIIDVYGLWWMELFLLIFSTLLATLVD